MGARLIGRSKPALTIIEGSTRLLRILCGEDERHPRYSLARYTPTVSCEISIAQPGLTISGLRKELATTPPDQSAQQIRELLTVWHDAVSAISTATLLSSE